jgi:hypothetical protein
MLVLAVTRKPSLIRRNSPPTPWVLNFPAPSSKEMLVQAPNPDGTSLLTTFPNQRALLIALELNSALLDTISARPSSFPELVHTKLNLWHSTLKSLSSTWAQNSPTTIPRSSFIQCPALALTAPLSSPANIRPPLILWVPSFLVPLLATSGFPDLALT